MEQLKQLQEKLRVAEEAIKAQADALAMMDQQLQVAKTEVT